LRTALILAAERLGQSDIGTQSRKGRKELHGGYRYIGWVAFASGYAVR
jgi:hypothetical protein